MWIKGVHGELINLNKIEDIQISFITNDYYEVRAYLDWTNHEWFVLKECKTEEEGDRFIDWIIASLRNYGEYLGG